MIKKISIASLCILLLFPLLFSIIAYANSTYMIDNANLLTQSQKQDLQTRLKELSDKTHCDVVILTINNLGTKTATEYADDYYDYNNFRDDGILLLISIEQRDWAISTKGSAIRTFTDTKQKVIMDDVKRSLANNNYNTAFTDFINWCDYYLTNNGKNAAAGIVFNWEWVYISLGIGVVIAFIVVTVMRGKLKTVHYQPAAENYVKRNSLVITRQNDFFLFRRINRTAIPKSSSGSRTHFSSSGSRHGGSSGKF